jgi:hypothetical protein
MMRSILVSVAALLLASVGFAQEVGGTIEGSVLVKGQPYKQVFAYGKMAEKQPSWDPFTSPCPLKRSKAVQLAIQKLKGAVPAVSHLKLASVRLNKVPEMEGKWYYYVKFTEKPEHEQGDFANVIVCLDGTVPDFQKERAK